MKRLTATLLTAAAASALALAISATGSATVSCDSSSCGVQALFDQLSSDLAVVPPNPIKQSLISQASNAEDLYPPNPCLTACNTNDFCPSYGLFGALMHHVDAQTGKQLSAEDANTLLTDIDTIRTIAYPPNPCISDHGVT